MTPRRIKYNGTAKGKATLAAAQRRYTAAHPEKIKALNADQYQKNRAGRIAYAMAWTAENREKTRVYVRKWEKANPDKCRHKAARRRAHLLRAVPLWTDLAAVQQLYAHAQKWNMQVDHVVPLINDIVCGLHVHANLQLLSASENASKQNRHWPDMP